MGSTSGAAGAVYQKRYGPQPTDDATTLQQKLDDLNSSVKLPLPGHPDFFAPLKNQVRIALDNATAGYTPPTQTTDPSAGPTDIAPGLLPSAPTTVTSPTGGIVLDKSASGKDEASLLAEAELQKQLAETSQSGIASQRSQNLTDLANLITQQQQHLISQNMPGIYEDLNTRGLLRSSELGNAVAREQAKAATNLQDIIGQQGISDRETNLSALSGIENNYLGGRSSAIQRGLSLQDWQRQVQASKDLGFAMQPQQPQGSGKSATGINTALGGAAVGSKFGPTGAAIGGTAGLLAGQGK